MFGLSPTPPHQSLTVSAIEKIMKENTSLNLSTEVTQEITGIVFEHFNLLVKPCDIIFIFGGSHPGLWITAAKAFHEGLGKTIVVTGGHKPGVKPHMAWVDGSTPESEVIKRELIKLSVPGNSIICENKSTNTLENVVFAKEVYDFSKVKNILVVCKNYGVGRQCRTMRRQIDTVDVIPYPFDTEAGNSHILVTRDSWMNHERSTTLVFTEVVKIYRYGKLGHLQPLEHISPALENLVLQYA
jgi:uncharacterized SAM-binding protein YcdF (DUF218 family)